jgi:hypothetical protein
MIGRRTVIGPPARSTRWPQHEEEKARKNADQAALLGTGLAAVIAVSFGPGAWGWWSTWVGMTLLLVIFSYYRIPDRTVRASSRARELLALAAITGLCSTLVVAYPVQSLTRDHREIPVLDRNRQPTYKQTVGEFCSDLGNAANFKAYDEIRRLDDGSIGNNTVLDNDTPGNVSGHDAEDKAYDDCLGRYGGIYVTPVGFILAVLSFVLWFTISSIRKPPGKVRPTSPRLLPLRFPSHRRRRPRTRAYSRQPEGSTRRSPNNHQPGQS